MASEGECVGFCQKPVLSCAPRSSSSLPAAEPDVFSDYIIDTNKSLHFHQHCHTKTSLEELKLVLFLSHIMHKTVTDICGSLSTARDVGSRQATAGFSELGRRAESTHLRGDDPLWTSARSKLNKEVRMGKKMNLPLATSSSLLGHVRKQGSCSEENSPGKAKRSPDCLSCCWQNVSFQTESRRVPATLRPVTVTHFIFLPDLKNTVLFSFSSRQ